MKIKTLLQLKDNRFLVTKATCGASSTNVRKAGGEAEEKDNDEDDEDDDDEEKEEEEAPPKRKKHGQPSPLPKPSLLKKKGSHPTL